MLLIRDTVHKLSTLLRFEKNSTEKYFNESCNLNKMYIHVMILYDEQFLKKN
jgi:hypothetical protein